MLSLDLITVASPCRANWAEMSGDDRIRFCSQCSKPVYDLSEMTRPEAEALIQEHEGHLCAKFYRRADGTILTADCPVGLWDVRTRFARLWAGALALVGFLTFGAWNWATPPDDPTDNSLGSGPVSALQESLQDPKVYLMGDIVLPIMPPAMPSTPIAPSGVTP